MQKHPTLYRKAMKRYSVFLDPETVTHFKKYGAGSLAAGIRSEWREMKAHGTRSAGSRATIHKTTAIWHKEVNRLSAQQAHIVRNKSNRAMPRKGLHNERKRSISRIRFLEVGRYREDGRGMGTHH